MCVLRNLQIVQNLTSEILVQNQPNNPLHGIKLKQIVKDLVEYYGWQQLSYHIDINCFKNDPSVKSSLYFLRRHEWARKEVEELWIKVFG